MIQVFHNSKKVLKIFKDNLSLEVFASFTIAETVYKLAEIYPDEVLFWCHEALESSINRECLPNLCVSNSEILSYTVSKETYISSAIGFVEQSIFINFSKEKRVATWQMSSAIGMAHAHVFAAVQGTVLPNKDFNYFLNSVAKIAMPLGVFCYSEPKLVVTTPNTTYHEKISFSNLFSFVSQHYKKIWLLVLFFCLVYKEKKFPLVAFLQSLFYKKIETETIKITPFQLLQPEENNTLEGIDVLIPTIGRKEPLYNFLKNLAQQTILPKNVIIIEQNAIENATTELTYLKTESWPFSITHQLIYQLGACNARNLALKEVTSNWVFFADDDIEIAPNFLENCLHNAKKYKQKVFSLSCLQKGENQFFKNHFQWVSFGSGASFVHKQALQNITFNKSYEFGFGEDADFGMQIRNAGYDVVYFPTPEILHLKAPMGGFRTKIEKKWDKEPVAPKPSPTVMVFKLTYDTKEQLFAYKLMLFFRMYNFAKLQNPITHYKNMKKRWDCSVFWAQQLMEHK